MKNVLILVGKTTDPHLKALLENYISRIAHYVPFEVKTVPAAKNTPRPAFENQCAAEGEAVKRLLQTGDRVILLDERGEECSSAEFANRLKRLWQTSAKRIVFVAGGPYGFSPAAKAAANGFMSLSKMTFSHQMARVIFAEQFYRALTIIKGDPYHHG